MSNALLIGGLATWVKSSLREYGIVAVTVLAFVILALTTPAFLTGPNLRNILDQQALVLIIASFVTIQLIAGAFDVSPSAIFLLSALVALRVENLTGSVVLTVMGGIACGLLCGLLNGVIVARLKIVTFIATLATSFILFGVGFLVSQGSILRPADAGIRAIAATRVLGLTYATVVALLIVVAAGVLLSKTRFGRQVYASGGNPEAARLSGVSVARVQLIAFALTGAAAGLAGTLNAARTLSAQASDDFSLVFAVIAAVIVGGTSIAGGSGAVWRTVVGVVFIALLGNGFNLNGVDPIYQRIIQGVVILIAVALDAWSRRRPG